MQCLLGWLADGWNWLRFQVQFGFIGPHWCKSLRSEEFYCWNWLILSPLPQSDVFAPNNKELHPPAGGTCACLPFCLRSQFPDSQLLLCDPTISSSCCWVGARESVHGWCRVQQSPSGHNATFPLKAYAEYINCAAAAAVAWLIQLHLLRNPHGFHLNKTRAVIKFLLEHSGGFCLSRRGRRHLVV